MIIDITVTPVITTGNNFYPMFVRFMVDQCILSFFVKPLTIPVKISLIAILVLLFQFSQR